MTDATTTTATTANTTATTANTGTTSSAAPVWYEGKADAEIVGHWQNKGWKLDDPGAIAIEATKAAREAQKFVGVPPEQLLRFPKDASDEAGWKAVHARLGVPADAKEYDFKGVKFADGTELQEGFTAAMRGALIGAKVSKDAAPTIVSAVVKYLDNADAEEAAGRIAKLTEEKAKLAKNWGPNEAANKFVATQGAKRLGISPEAVAALEQVIGYADTMEAMRKVGALSGEDRFIGGDRPGGGIMTREAAVSRKQELMADPAWVKSYLDKDAAKIREMTALNMIISGDDGSGAARAA